MKKTMALGALLCTLNATATDRIVEEFGISPTYPNITAAVNAAVDGDRIVIKNRAGNIPWIEDINITKSLEFLSFSNDDFFYAQGNYTVTAAPGRSVTIISMRNTAGSIQGTGGGNPRDTKVRILDSYFVNGSVNLNLNVFDVDLVASTLMYGSVSICFGNVVGSTIDASLLSDDAISVSPSNGNGVLDTCAIVGNKVKGPQGYNGIFVYTALQVVHLRNNYIEHGYMGIRAYAGNTAAVQNLIWNNTITAWTGQFTTYGIDMANTNAGSIWEIMNNAVTRTWSGECRGINKDSGNQGQINVYYNHVASGISTPVSPDFTFVSNNTTSQPISLNTDGSLDNAPGCVNGGNPATVLSDLDLSVGDAGAYGGSYTLTNFFPLHTGAARTYLTAHPFNVRQGSTLRVRGVSFDR